jgi:hypothetical protein
VRKTQARSRSARRRTAAAAMAVTMALAVATTLAAGPAAAAASIGAGAGAARHHLVGVRVRVVASFDPAKGQNPENLAIAADGTVYVTWLFAHSVVAIRSDGTQAVVTLPAGEATGVAIDPTHPDRLAVGLIASNPAAAGIWTVPISAFPFGGHGQGVPTRRVALPVAAFPNGLTYATDGTLYVADSTRGAILRVAPGASTATTWLSTALLTPTGALFQGVPLPGVNGLKLHHGQLYATNTARGLLLHIPIRHHTAHQGPGTAGTPSIVRSGLAFDDFAIDDHGVVIAALNISDQVVRFTLSSRGPVVVLADKPHDDVENPSAVVVGPDGELLVTSAAYFGTHPALQRIQSNSVGASRAGSP